MKRPVDAATMRDIDQKAQSVYGIPELLLMENAGRETAAVILGKAKDAIRKGGRGSVAFFCGKGNNGGDGFVAARHLFLEEMPVVVFHVSDKARLKEAARVHFEMLTRFGCPVVSLREGEADPAEWQKRGPFLLAVDALLGIGLKGDIQEPYRRLIVSLNALPCPRLAVDIPSGLCATTGKILGRCVQADVTVTFGLPKKGFALGDGPSVTGEVLVRNIGYPKALLL